MPAINFRQLNDQIRIAQVLDLIHWHHNRRSGDELRGPCPIHGSDNPERSRIFAVNLSKSCFRCWSRRCGAYGNALDLWTLTQGYGDRVHAAARDLCDRLAIPVPWIKTEGKWSHRRRSAC